MNDLLLHPKTAANLETILRHPPQGLLLTGEAGSGKDTTARYIAAGILELVPAKLGSYPYLHVLDPADATISIEQIRELQQFLKLTVPSEDKTGIRRVVIVSRAERMRTEAQNALLKTLEEPPADTCIILTAESAERLLPTITSRTHEVPVLPVSYEQAKAYIGTAVTEAKLKSSYALSMGQAGLLLALLNDQSHPLRSQVELAKSLLGSPAGERLMQVESLSKDKPGLKLLLGAFARIAHAGLQVAGSKNQIGAIKQWRSRQEAILASREAYEHNANTKLLLTDLFLSL